MKKIIILISITMLIATGILLSNENKSFQPVSSSKIMEISGKIQAIMTNIPVRRSAMEGPSVAFIKIKVKNLTTGQESSVQIAPGYFLKIKGVVLQKNDQIKIKAFRKDNSAEIQSLEIETRGRVLVIRDRFGNGLWEKPQLRPKRSGFGKK